MRKVNEKNSRPRICELFDTETAAEYTLLDHSIRRDYQHTKEPLKPIQIPRGIKHPTCYLCNIRLKNVHWFYHRICFECGEASYAKRYITRDLTGQRAIVTGGRVKLGYQIALKLLRAGAEVMITSRNWNNALLRYEDEPDYETWKNRLHVCKMNLDLLRIDEHLEEFDDELNRIWPDHPGIDIVIHNAAQTISGVEETPFVGSISLHSRKRKRDEDEDEKDVKVARTEEKSLSESRKSRKYPPIDWVETVFPEVDRYQRKLDQRESNTWSAKFGTVRPGEAKQVLLANAWAPFVLNQILLPRLKASRYKPYIIHVHAKEGHFSSHKTLNHTHTNMAKAALCMMTRCLAGTMSSYASRQEYQKEWSNIPDELPWAKRYKPSFVPENPIKHKGRKLHKETEEINVHGVDPGWFSVDEYTLEDRVKKNLFFPVIDEIDAASRVLYPVFIGAPSFEGTWRQYLPLLTF